MKNTKELEAFISGMETTIKMIRENMGGGALRIFDLHCFPVEDLIKQFKEKIK